MFRHIHSRYLQVPGNFGPIYYTTVQVRRPIWRHVEQFFMYFIGRGGFRGGFGGPGRGRGGCRGLEDGSPTLA